MLYKLRDLLMGIFVSSETSEMYCGPKSLSVVNFVDAELPVTKKVGVFSHDNSVDTVYDIVDELSRFTVDKEEGPLCHPCEITELVETTFYMEDQDKNVYYTSFSSMQQTLTMFNKPEEFDLFSRHCIWKQRNLLTQFQQRRKLPDRSCLEDDLSCDKPSPQPFDI